MPNGMEKLYFVFLLYEDMKMESFMNVTDVLRAFHGWFAHFDSVLMFEGRAFLSFGYGKGSEGNLD